MRLVAGQEHGRLWRAAARCGLVSDLPMPSLGEVLKLLIPVLTLSACAALAWAFVRVRLQGPDWLAMVVFVLPTVAVVLLLHRAKRQ